MTFVKFEFLYATNSSELFLCPLYCICFINLSDVIFSFLLYLVSRRDDPPLSFYISKKDRYTVCDQYYDSIDKHDKYRRIKVFI